MRTPIRRLAALASGALLALTALAVPTPAQAPATATPPGARDVTAVLFQWDWTDVGRACTDTLGPAGYGYVQVSPPQETIQGGQWWISYQPVSYAIGNRQGTRAEFAAMVSTCHGAGVKVIADAVVNHMSAGSGTGTLGTPYSKYRYPAHYADQDFHGCRSLDHELRRPVAGAELRARRPVRPRHRQPVRAARDRRLPRRPALARGRRPADRRGQAHVLVRPRGHQGEDVGPGHLLGAGGHLRRRRADHARGVHRHRRRARVPVRDEPQAGVPEREALVPGELRPDVGDAAVRPGGAVRRQPRHRAQRLDPDLPRRLDLHAGQRLHAGLAVRLAGRPLRLRVHRPRRGSAARRRRGVLLRRRLEVPARLARDRRHGRLPQRGAGHRRDPLVGQRERPDRVRTRGVAGTW